MLEDHPFLADWVSPVTSFSHSGHLCLNVEALTRASYGDYDPDPANVPDQLHIKVDLLMGDRNGGSATFNSSVFELHFTVGPARIKLATELLGGSEWAQIVVHMSADITFNVTIEQGHCQRAEGQFERTIKVFIYRDTIVQIFT